MITPATLLLERLQFAWIATIHILWPALTIGLGVALFVTEGWGLWRHNPACLAQARYWTRPFALNFVIGVVTGLPLEFAFGTNWGPLAQIGGGLLGNLLGFEAVLAFMLEAAFLPIMVFAWDRVSARMHWLATGLVTLGAVLSAFWIMAANAWMQTPTGVIARHGRLVVQSYSAAIFNPDLPYAFAHMLLAALMVGLAFVAAVSAWRLRHGGDAHFFENSWRAAAIGLGLLGVLQILVGDAAGVALSHTQPAKIAAMEAHWRTNPPGTPASWHVLVWPQAAAAHNRWAVTIPKVGGLVIRHVYAASIPGLRAFPAADRPPVLIPFYAFRIMVIAGFYIALLGLAALFSKRLRTLALGPRARNRWLLAWQWTLPAACGALECGWAVREVGRQPWAIYGLLRTQAAATVMPAPEVGLSLAALLLFEIGVASVGVVLLQRLLRQASPPSEAV